MVYIGDAITEPLPANSTLLIPGDVFPAISSYSLDEPIAPVRISPSYDSDISVESVYSWEAGADSQAYIVLAFGEYDAAGTFQGYPIVCTLADDGQFDLPGEVLNVISSASNAFRVWYIREKSYLDFKDGVVFYRRSSVSE